MTLPLDALYRDIILDHYRSPRGRGELKGPDTVCRGSNPSCGDDLTLALKIRDDKIHQAQITTKGCAISIASSSMLAEVIEGKTLDEAIQLGETIRRMMRNEGEPDELELGDLDALKGIRNFPVRVKCALLAWVALLGAIKDYRAGKESGSITISTE